MDRKNLKRLHPPSSVPPVADWFQQGFHRFLRPYLRRHFHAIAVTHHRELSAELPPDVPLIVYGNHPSWWDPLIAHFLNRQLFPGRQFYAPIDAAALEQYRVFGKLGFYGVRLDSTSGAAAFLKRSVTILNHGDTAIWMTPEGRFADVRDHSASLMPGLPHLCTRLRDGWVVPLGLEYVFWEERLPVCLARTGEPIRVAEHLSLSKPQWGEHLTARLRENQNELAQLSIERRADSFENLLRGTGGAGAVYDSFRRIKAVVTGKSFRSQHGDHFG